MKRTLRPFALLLVVVGGAWLLVAAGTPLAAANAGKQSACGFTLGFAALRDRLPREVGACLEDERHDPTTGDAVQQTTGGLLVWRKLDNRAAFTDGTQSWVDGPYGPQRRGNDQRFAWEPNPERLSITPPPAPGERCHPAGLTLEVAGSDAGAGNVVATFRFRNELAVPCTFYGYVGAQLLAADRQPLPTQVVRGGGFLAGDPGPTLVRVAPSGTAAFRVHWGQVEVGDERSCPAASSLAVIPPDEYSPLIVPVTIRACGGGRLNLGALQAAP